MSEQTAGPGHNRPPVTEIWKQENETLAKRIAEDNAAISKRKNDLIAEADALPKVIKNDEQSGEFSDLVGKLRGVAKDAETIRVSTKAPVLEAQRIIDALFGKFKKSVEDKITDLNRIGTIYDLAKEAKARARLEEEAQARREEEDRARAEAERLAKKTKSAAKIVAAAEDVAAARADRIEAERAADVKPAELTRTRGEASTSCLAETYHGEITDYEKIDINTLRKYITRTELDKAAERAAKDLESAGVGAIKHLRIFSTKERRVS